MAIVLAIEPDRRQAAHLAAIVRQQVGADLVIADTTEGALDAIGNRVPDLVLVPALLSPQDDAALAAALRVIAAAAHVRTLTIPVLANGTKKRAPVAGMLAKWRKNRTASQEPDGCDPAVFGEQISTYLQEAAAERAQIAEDELLADEPMPAALPTAIEPVAIAAAPPSPMDDAPPEFALALQDDVQFETVAAAEPPPPVFYEQPWVESSEPWVAAPVQPATAYPLEQSASEPGDEPMIDLSEELEGLSEESDAERFDGEAVGVYTISAGADDPIESLDLMPAILEPPAPVQPAASALDLGARAPAAVPEARVVEPLFTDEMFVESLFTDEALPALVLEKPVFSETLLFESPEPVTIEPSEPPRADIERWAPMYLSPGRIWPALEGVPAETPVARTEQPDWIELVASLRKDLERRRTDPASVAPPVDTRPVAARPSDGASANPLRLVKKPRPATAVRKAKPLQDEWGFFDPERCGFSTLLAKLEEITEEDART